MNSEHESIRRTWRFSLASLLFLTTCVAGYLSGYQIGHQQGMLILDSTSLVAMTYDVSDITEDSIDLQESNQESNQEAIDGMIDSIVTNIAPVSWMENGIGHGEIQVRAVPGKVKLVVSANLFVHTKVREFLEKMREDKNPI